MDTSKLATKKDIKYLKTDIKDLKAESKSIRREILRVEEKVDNLEEGQKRLEEELRELRADNHTKLDRLQNTLDGFIGTVDDLRTDNTVGTHHTRELQIKVDDHEKRLKQIESSKVTT